MTTDRIDSQRAPEPVGAYPHARRVGNLLFLSGLGPRQRGSLDIPGVVLDEKGRIVSLDFAVQCQSVFENVSAVLEEAGSSFDRIVDVTVFLTNMERDFATYNRLYAEWFAGPGKPNPARTTVEVRALPQAGNAPISIELKVIATVD
jgi:2-aminomuconate deaminase